MVQFSFIGGEAGERGGFRVSAFGEGSALPALDFLFLAMNWELKRD